jgi:hypothetical protein
MLQQMTESGLVKCLEVLVEATVPPPQEAEPASGSGLTASCPASEELLHYQVATLLRIQVSWGMLWPVQQQL